MTDNILIEDQYKRSSLFEKENVNYLVVSSFYMISDFFRNLSLFLHQQSSLYRQQVKE